MHHWNEQINHYLLYYLAGIVLLHHHHGGDSNSHSFLYHHGYSPQALPQTRYTASHPGELDQYLGQSRHCSKPQHLESTVHHSFIKLLFDWHIHNKYAICLHILYCPEQAPMGTRSSSTKYWGWAVTRKRCLNGSTIPGQAPTPDVKLATRVYRLGMHQGRQQRYGQYSHGRTGFWGRKMVSLGF